MHNMRIVNTVMFMLTVKLSFIESSSPAGSSTASPDRRERSRSPSASFEDPLTRPPSSDVLGYRFDQLRYIRLTPTRNPHRQFELRRYSFTADRRLKFLDRNSFFPPVPSQEQIVLSTHDGDIFAILTRSDTLAALYRYIHHTRNYKRIRVNIESGRITRLTPDEREEVPVGDSHLIQSNFRVEHLNYSDGSLPSVERDIPANPSSHIALPFSNVLGYGIHQLQFIRLCYKGNMHRLFELRRYTFPADKLMKVITEHNRFRPIPIQERIVLSTYGGDVFALLETGDILVGIYAHDPITRSERRAKINMMSGRISLLTSDEIHEVPVGPHRGIELSYIVDLINHTPSLH